MGLYCNILLSLRGSHLQTKPKWTFNFEQINRMHCFLMSISNVIAVVIENVFISIVGLFKLLVPEQSRFKDVKKDIILVTGGGSGIGRLMCLKYAKLGATVVTWDINAQGNDETAKMIKKEGGKVFTYKVDMSNREEIYEMATKVQEEVGDVTILVNNAGIVSGSLLLDTPDNKIIRTFDVNIMAHFWTIKAFLPTMIKNKRGHIVNVASLAGHSGTNKLVDYCSSKFAAVGLDEALRVELFTQGHSEYIKTTCICPYYISTGMFSGVYSKVIPILEPEYVADRAVSGVLTNTEMVLVPGWTFLLIALKAVIPTDGFMKLSQAFGLNCSMDQFTGRTKKD